MRIRFRALTFGIPVKTRHFGSIMARFEEFKSVLLNIQKTTWRGIEDLRNQLLGEERRNSRVAISDSRVSRAKKGAGAVSVVSGAVTFNALIPRGCFACFGCFAVFITRKVAALWSGRPTRGGELSKHLVSKRRKQVKQVKQLYKQRGLAVSAVSAVSFGLTYSSHLEGRPTPADAGRLAPDSPRSIELRGQNSPFFRSGPSSSTERMV